MEVRRFVLRAKRRSRLLLSAVRWSARCVFHPVLCSLRNAHSVLSWRFRPVSCDCVRWSGWLLRLECGVPAACSRTARSRISSALSHEKCGFRAVFVTFLELLASNDERWVTAGLSRVNCESFHRGLADWTDLLVRLASPELSFGFVAFVLRGAGPSPRRGRGRAPCAVRNGDGIWRDLPCFRCGRGIFSLEKRFQKMLPRASRAVCTTNFLQGPRGGCHRIELGDTSQSLVTRTKLWDVSPGELNTTYYRTRFRW